MSKIAFVICNYNDSRFLISLVEKIVKQEPDELIIVDDCSTDGSLILIHYLQEQYPKIKLVKCEAKNPFGAFVAGCQATDAEYISCWSADDYPDNCYLWKMKKAIDDYPFVDLYTCNADVIRENMKFERILLPFDAYISPDYAAKIFKAGYAKNINLCGVLMKRELVLKCWEKGGKDTKVNFDCMFAFYSIFEKGFINLGDRLATYRSYPNSYGAAGRNKEIKQATEAHKKMYCKNPYIYYRALASGIWGVNARWKALIALWLIMKLPKWARVKFYKWFYSYNEGVEKL
jgi:glycosyltransferase involved in cell wall biosynthesis